MNTLFITSEFPPSNGAGVFRSLRFARYLAEHGVQVHVVTKCPACYEPGTSVDESLLKRLPESVQIHSARVVYPLRWANELRDSITLKHFRGASHSKAVAKTSTNGANGDGHSSAIRNRGWFQAFKDSVTLPLMTPDRHVGWIPFAVKQAKRVIRNNPVDVLYSSGPPFSNHLVGLKLKRKFSIPWVADFRDPWVIAHFKPTRNDAGTWVGRRHQSLERQVIEAADRVILNTNRSYDSFVERYPEIPSENFLVIPNGFDPADYPDAPGDHEISASTKRRKLVLAHAGTFYGKRNIFGLLEAIDALVEEDASWRERLELQLIGADRDGKSAERQFVDAHGLEDVVRLTPRIPHAECLNKLREADALLLVQVEAPLSVPGKVFEYLALRKPIFALADDGATSDIVQQNSLGICVPPDDVGAIKTALRQLVDRFQETGTLPVPANDVVERFNGRLLTNKLLQTLNDAISAAGKTQSNSDSITQ